MTATIMGGVNAAIAMAGLGLIVVFIYGGQKRRAEETDSSITWN